jgi:hypothetical protein
MMRRLAAVSWLVLVVLAGEAGAQAPFKRDPTPEGVTVWFEAAGLIPLGGFGDAAQAGFAPTFGGYYPVLPFLAPAFQVQWAFLEPDRSRTGGVGSLDAMNALLGVRAMLPGRRLVRPWGTLLFGIAHYEAYRDFFLEPIFSNGKHTRTDPMLAVGGGVDFDVHPNFSIGADLRGQFSFSTGRSGEGTLSAITLGAVATFHY